MTAAGRAATRPLTWALLGTLALLLAHAAVYRFLCDDAFISFRYARNLAHGYGLVFNPGHERVEGYTNFLWVLVLAAGDRLGLVPERLAPALSVLLTIVLWGLVARASFRWVPTTPVRWIALVPLVWLGATRSIAVWSTSGLETRAFEVLIIAGVFRLIDDVSVRIVGDAPRAPWAAVLLALAEWTRPDGLLIAAAAFGTAGAILALRKRLSLRDAIVSAATFSALVGAQFAFRLAYYGVWFPNTYYAKVGGRSWWGMGGAYLACFAVEYAAWLWVPLLIAGVLSYRARGEGHVPALFAAAVIPHALYIASIGGDHFEYRPLDLYFPFAFLLMARGLAMLTEGTLRAVGTAATALAVVVGLVAIPARTHLEFPGEYRVGYPGIPSGDTERDAFPDPARDPVYRWPGLRALAELHRALLETTTSRLVGIRQEEHKLFLATVVPEGRALAALVDRGVLPRDTHVAISCVGAIPYYSDLRVLDRLGLTDAAVARSAPGAFRVIAHDKHATVEYARAAGVDLWSTDPVHLIFPIADERLVFALDESRETHAAVYWADAGDGSVFVVSFPSGESSASARFPRLTFHRCDDEAAYASLVARIVTARREALAASPGSRDAKLALAVILTTAGRLDEAEPLFADLAGSGDAEGLYNLGTLRAQRGDLEGGASLLRQAVQAAHRLAMAHFNLAIALERLGRGPEALSELRQARQIDPSSAKFAYTLGAALLASGDAAGARECVAELRALDFRQADAYADRLEGALGKLVERVP